MLKPKHVVFIPLFLFVYTIIFASVANSAEDFIITAAAKHRLQESSRTSGSAEAASVIPADPDNKVNTCSQPAVASLPSLTRSITAKAAIIKDGISGRVLYAHNPDLERQPASTIKVLAALIALDNLKDREWVFTSNRASGMPRSKIYLNRGKSYYARDLIESLLISSANDAGVALGETIAGSEWSFARMMTAKARELGASNTVCKSATGLTRRGQKSTVRDLATIFDKAMEDPDFADILRTKKGYTSYGRLLRNHNKALWRIKGAVAGKTGYTNVARQTYVGQFKRHDKEIIVAVMGSETMWSDISRLVNTGFRVWGDELSPAPSRAVLVANKKQKPAENKKGSIDQDVARLRAELRNDESSSVISGSKKSPSM
ncbi:MAG: D-alanyl-D-alanine carboxypeptidase family protein [Desulfurivibrionaceae bacterium]